MAFGDPEGSDDLARSAAPRVDQLRDPQQELTKVRRAESRKWRTATGKKLSAMEEGERLAYLNQDVAGKLQALRKKASGSKARRPRKAGRAQAHD